MRQEQFIIRLTAEEKARYVAVAKKMGITTSALIRLATNKYINEVKKGR